MRTKRILVTGSSGLIGTALSAALHHRERHVLGMDLKGKPELRLDVRDVRHPKDNLDCVAGIVHLAAVSRVIQGELQPEVCWSVNVEGTHAVLELASRLCLRPWVIYASSREVYGEPATLPVTEDAPQKPLNVYGRSKVALVCEARDRGVRACVLRFSSVYGSVHDYPDRVVPAFASAAARGGTLRVDNEHSFFDFTHVVDVVDGLLKLIDMLEAGEAPPPPAIHLTTGTPTTLRELAGLAVELGEYGTSVAYATPRTYDVQQFYGNPSRAAEILGWEPNIRLRSGFTDLVNELRINRQPSLFLHDEGASNCN